MSFLSSTINYSKPQDLTQLILLKAYNLTRMACYYGNTDSNDTRGLIILILKTLPSLFSQQPTEYGSLEFFHVKSVTSVIK